MATRIRILVIDEAVLDRDALRGALADAPDVELLGVAPTARTGLARLDQVEADLLLLSAGLADLSAAEATRLALAARPRLGVLLMTADRTRHAAVAIAALEAGALDVMVKPAVADDNQRGEAFRRVLLPKIRSLSTVIYARLARNMSVSSSPARAAASGAATAPAVEQTARRRRVEADVVLVGLSTGGSEALSRLLPRLPASLPPVVVVLHMPAQFTASLAEDLDRRCALAVREAEDGDVLVRGTVYLAPGGRHLELERGTRRRLVLHVTDAPPRNGCRPSVDLLFSSAASACPAGALALIMTGMGSDGVEGLAALKGRGRSHVLAQDEASSVIWGMPGSAVRAGVVDEVLPLEKLAPRVAELVGGP